MDPLGIPGSWVLSTSKNSRAGIFFAELLQKWKRRVVPLYVHTTKKEKSCIWHEIEVIPLRIWWTISSFNKRPPIEELAFKKIAHLVTYIQYSFVYQWTQWLRWKIAKAFVYFSATLLVRMRSWISCFFFVLFCSAFLRPSNPVSRGGGWSVLATVLST